MKRIILTKIHMENFKVFKDTAIDFGMLTKIFAQNYKGKSSIADAFSFVLFGKSSTGNSEGKQFIPRRYDSEGTPIDHVDVTVELTLEIDNRPITIKKVQSQNWVRKRGAEIEAYEGDTNEYFWNEVPVKEAEHKRRVAEIVDEEVFRLITNPHAFVSKKQDEQRKFLVEKVAQITDEDVFSIDGSFSELRTKMEAEGKSLEEIKAVNKKALQGYKEQQESIPVRIDETSKLIVDLDFAEQELALSALKMQMEEVERKISDTSEAYGEVGKIKTEIAEWNGKLTDIERAEKERVTTKRRDVQGKYDNASYSLLKKYQSKNDTIKDIELLKEKISSTEVFFETVKKRYSDEKAIEYDASKNNCPVCGKEFEEDKKSELLTAFETDKKSKLYQINLDGASTRKTLEENRTKLTELETNLSTLTAEAEKLAADETNLKAEIASLPSEIDLSTNTDYQGIKATITALENALLETQKSLADTDTLKAELTARKADITTQIDAVKAELARKQTIDDAKDRVMELQAEFKVAVARGAECERLDFLLEKFNKAKMTMLSERINKSFKVVKWELFRKQKNGGTEDVCVCTIHGAPYGENTTSTTERLMAGLDIVSTLQEIYGVKAPIWIDGKESYNDKNVPMMDCQMVMLTVSDDAEIRVEVGNEK